MTISRALFTTLFALALTTAVVAQQIAFTWEDLPAHSALPQAKPASRSATSSSPP